MRKKQAGFVSLVAAGVLALALPSGSAGAADNFSVISDLPAEAMDTAQMSEVRGAATIGEIIDGALFKNFEGEDPFKNDPEGNVSFKGDIPADPPIVLGE